MAKYIEKEVAVKIAEKYGLTNGSVLGRHSGIADCIASEIATLPIADVVPVRHGRWEKQRGLYSCSECGMTCPYDVQADVIEYWACSYCPRCGAKMDGGNGNSDMA